VLELQRAGTVRHIGMSGTVPHLADHIAMGVFDVFQIPYSAVEREHEALIDVGRERLRYKQISTEEVRMATVVPPIPESTPTRPSYLDGRPKRMLINGQWVEAASGKTFDTINPATGATLATIAEGDAEDINRAVAAARRAFEGPWSKFKPYERQHVILRLADLIEQHFEEFSVLDILDMGAPIARSRANRHRTLGRMRYYAAMAGVIHGETIENSLPGEFVSYTLKEPVGMVGAIIPWNGPLGSAVWSAGNA
jgi:hypothetical protein